MFMMLQFTHPSQDVDECYFIICEKGLGKEANGTLQTEKRKQKVQMWFHITHGRKANDKIYVNMLS